MLCRINTLFQISAGQCSLCFLPQRDSMFSYGCAALILYRIASVNHLHSLNFKEEERWIIQAPDVLSIVACAQKNDSWKIESLR